MLGGGVFLPSSGVGVRVAMEQKLTLRSSFTTLGAFPDYDGLREIVDGLDYGIGLLLGAGAVDERIWEAIGWDVLDS
jgi:hypothetical protein